MSTTCIMITYIPQYTPHLYSSYTVSRHCITINTYSIRAFLDSSKSPSSLFISILVVGELAMTSVVESGDRGRLVVLTSASLSLLSLLPEVSLHRVLAIEEVFIECSSTIELFV